ncbi:MAG: glycosyltransferase [Tannerellaceae bacterium]|nr:glycosyltransferase [Tannerellaceae bacterium]
MPDVSVIIVNYNTRELILQCLQSVYDCTKDVHFEVIVVDNNSSDGSVEAVRLEYPQVKLIANCENQGFGKANNTGAVTAGGKYLFLLNSDCILLNNAVKIFFDNAEKLQGERIGALGSLLLDAEEGFCHSYGNFGTFGRMLKNHLMDYVYHVFPKKRVIVHPSLPFDVDYIVGADLFLPRKVIDEIGFFDEQFFMYSEENELQYRMFLNNYRRVIIDGPRIIHLEGKSIQVKVNREIMRYTSLFKYIRKYNNSFKYYVFRWAMFFLLLPKVLFVKGYSGEDRKRYFRFLLS